jgi:hypothetical protein
MFCTTSNHSFGFPNPDMGTGDCVVFICGNSACLALNHEQASVALVYVQR